MPVNRERPYHVYIRTEECFYDELIEIEAERIVLEALSLVRANQGFIYLDHTAWPVTPRTPDSFTPAGSYSVKERIGITYDRYVKKLGLIEEVGRENVWIGPQISDRLAYPGLSQSEQRGFWARVD